MIRAGLLALICCAAAPVAAQSFNGIWEGRLRCDAVAGMTQTPLDVAFTIRVEAGLAKYERPVLSATAARTGAWERGEGRVAADGELMMQGGSSGRGFGYRARYEGRLGADGIGHFTGAQDWILSDREFTRACTVEVRK
ncbi:MAG: hypothetical protein EBT34_08550 [Acetobacteraceae bacterium]|nr:hypothetical protein [Acetobacteraceae bacterium]